MTTRTYTPEEYARRLRVSVKTIYRQIRAGSLCAERIGRQYRIVISIPSPHLSTGQ